MKWITLAVFCFFVLCVGFLNYDFSQSADSSRDVPLVPNPGQPDLEISGEGVELNVDFEGLGLWMQQFGEMDSDQLNYFIANFDG